MKTFIAICFSFALSIAHAQPSSNQIDAARKVVELMDYKAMFGVYLAQCQKPSGTYLDPTVVFKSDPGSFIGVSPQSAYWPEVEAAFRKYQARACAYLSADEFAEFVAKQYASRTSLEDLNALIAFQSSPTGRRLQQANVSVNEAFQAHAQASMLKVIQETYKETQSELRAIAERYERDPK